MQIKVELIVDYSDVTDLTAEAALRNRLKQAAQRLQNEAMLLAAPDAKFVKAEMSVTRNDLPNMQKDYVAACGNICPSCGHTQVTAQQGHDFAGKHVFQDIRCESCHAYWTDVYTLTGFEELYTQ